MKLFPNTSPEPAPPDSKPTFWVAAAIITAVLLWGLAVALPVWETRSEQFGNWDAVPGYFPALLGWLGLIVLCPAWFANLLLVPLCILLVKRRTGGYLLSLVALAVAASAYMLPGLYGDNDEAVIMRRLIGFYFWLGSFLILALAHALLVSVARRQRLMIRVGVVLLMVLGIAALERIYRVGTTPLETALRNPGDLTALTATLAKNPSQADKDAALWWALRQDLSADRSAPSKRLTLLIAAGANPNKADKFGDTLLMQAVRDEAFLKLLVQAGADVNAQDSRGKTILDRARECGSSAECQKILVDAGAHPGDQK
jgi:hypothetical protein